MNIDDSFDWEDDHDNNHWVVSLGAPAVYMPAPQKEALDEELTAYYEDSELLG